MARATPQVRDGVLVNSTGATGQTVPVGSEVWRRWLDDVRRFLLHTSVVDRLSGPLCDALVGETGQTLSAGDGQTMLERLEAANLFFVPLGDDRTWYRYHHLFADFLRAPAPRAPRSGPRCIAAPATGMSSRGCWRRRWTMRWRPTIMRWPHV